MTDEIEDEDPFGLNGKPLPGAPEFRTLGPSLSRDIEGAYRRGFHQAVAFIAEELKRGRIAVRDLEAWAGPGDVTERGIGPDGIGWRWRKDLTLEEKIDPPPFKRLSE